MISRASTRENRWANASSSPAGYWMTTGVPFPHALIEIWQTNAAGRYRHAKDNHPAPLDPNFTGAGRTLTDENGVYRFITIKPGAYPWKQSPQRVASGAYSLLAFWTGVLHAPDHPDVFPGRPADSFRSSSAIDPRRESAGSVW